jgi:hypothetical protein
MPVNTAATGNTDYQAPLVVRMIATQALAVFHLNAYRVHPHEHATALLLTSVTCACLHKCRVARMLARINNNLHSTGLVQGVPISGNSQLLLY